MRKRIALILLIMMMSMVFFTGCASISSYVDTGISYITTLVSDIWTGITDFFQNKSSWDETIITTDTIKNRGYLIAGVRTDVPKFGYKNPKTGEISGMEVDIAKSLARYITGDSNNIRLVEVNEVTRASLIDSRDIDIAVATFPKTSQNIKEYNLSEPYYYDKVGVMCHRGDNIIDLKELVAKKTATVKGGEGASALGIYARNLKLTFTFVEYNLASESKSALSKNEVDCYGDNMCILNAYSDSGTTICSKQVDSDGFGVASKRGYNELAKFMSDKITEMKSSKELNVITAKWGLEKQLR